MTTEVTLHLPMDVVHEVELAASQSQRQVADVLVRSVQTGLRSLVASSELGDFATMSDTEVLEMADGQMPADQSQRMSELLDRQREGTIERLERAELAMLMQFYQTGQLLKAGALAEAVRRKIREPLSP